MYPGVVLMRLNVSIIGLRPHEVIGKSIRPLYTKDGYLLRLYISCSPKYESSSALTPNSIGTH